LYWKLPVYPWNACIFPIALLFLKIVLKIPLRLPSNVKGHYYEYLNVDFHTFKEDLRTFTVSLTLSLHPQNSIM
jgi:hypothetical protein